MQVWHTINKADWPTGPWSEEPDKIHWVDEASDLDCLIVRNHLGALCGYVGVPKQHPWYGMDYDTVPVQAHGGITYSAKCAESEDDPHGICHVPLPGRTPDVWWLGFDCAHLGDLVPLYDQYLPESLKALLPPGTYRTVDYVTGHYTTLAARAVEVAK